jgi:hypothetical protein
MKFTKSDNMLIVSIRNTNKIIVMGELRMKRWKLIPVALLMVTLTGCIQENRLPDQKADIIAEYMAGLVLKYNSYDSSLLPMNMLEEEKTEEVVEEANELTNASDQSEDANTATEQASQNEDNTAKSNESTTKPSEEPEEQLQNYTLSEVIGMKEFAIDYSEYELTDTYSENDYFSITARKGYQLLIATFTVKNQSKEKAIFNLNKREIKYQLDVNSGTIFKPLLTYSDRDIQYINMPFEKEETKNVVLIFEIPQKTELSDLNLIVSSDDKSGSIKLK